MIRLPKQVNTALSGLHRAGFEACIVGGCVRDMLLGKTPQDFDITTNARPAQVEAVFADARVIETGLRHGTVTLLLDGMPLEITTYRVDLGYSDGRHPDRVAFAAHLEDDLSRRDFTVNAMAWNPERGLVDLFGGQADLEKGLLRCVGDPKERFREDALRILRLLRFASKLGFSVEPETASAAIALRENLKLVSMERIQKELTGLLCGREAGNTILEYLDILAVFLPELGGCRGFLQHNPHHRYDVLTHLCRTVDAIRPEPVLRLAALLHDIGKPHCFTLDADGIGHFYGHAKQSAGMADEILGRLRLDNASRQQVVTLIKTHDLPLSPPERTVRRALSRLGTETFFRLLELKRADILGLGFENTDRQAILDAAEAEGKRLLEAKACFSLRELAVKGDDLLALGVPEGREVGSALSGMLGAVLDGLVPNEKSALLQWWEAQR